jgi:hypothetical protein
MNRKATSTKDDPDLFQRRGIAKNGDSQGEAKSHLTGDSKLGKPVACGHHHAHHRAMEVIEGLSFPLLVSIWNFAIFAFCISLFLFLFCDIFLSWSSISISHCF